MGGKIIYTLTWKALGKITYIQSHVQVTDSNACNVTTTDTRLIFHLLIVFTHQTPVDIPTLTWKHWTLPTGTKTTLVTPNA